MKLKLKQGTTSKLVRIFVQDTSQTDGRGLTGLAYDASGLIAYYLPEGDASPVAISLASGTTGAWSSGGFSEVSASYLPGVYELGLPDAVVDATSEGSVVVMMSGATNMAPVLCELELDAVDYRDATAFGVANLDAAISTRSTFDYSSNQVIVATSNDKTGYALAITPPTAAAVADAVLDEALSGHTSSGTLGEAIGDGVTTWVTATGFNTTTPPTVNAIADQVWDELQSAHTIVGSFGYNLDGQVSSSGAGGSGLYQVTVRAQDSGLNSLQGARVNVDGTTLTLVADSSGEVTFNLDSGVYLLEMSPPAGYDTPVGQVVTVASADPADTVFTLTLTDDPADCSPVWVG